ncbi:MAG: glycosyltransferase [Candidatus Riflebacteria bacterium HGW-Riflebacteria-1]|jgi:dolichol-phosphate mannosyltransferase|nr:MAG: glycosyltransferase [Candidatus Riflebacteria bacterium HGW-Riflebacteria-1]
MKKTVAIVVAFLNEEENLSELYQRVSAVFEKEPEEVQFLFVDDGSTDGSLQCLEQIRQNDPRVRILQLSRNFGHQIAITAGTDHADADAVVIIDADLQDPPEVIPDLIVKWREGFEVVYAVRKSREGETWLKKFLAASFYRVFYMLAKVNVPMDAGDFRLVDRKVVDALKEVRELHRFMRGLTCWVGFKQGAVYYDRAARKAGETKYPVWKSLRLAFDAITSFSATPLRWMTVLGALIAFSGFIQGIRVIAGRILHPESFEPGWATVVALILLLAGVQLLSLGLVGQYVSRIFEESKKRPLYFLRNQ